MYIDFVSHRIGLWPAKHNDGLFVRVFQTTAGLGDSERAMGYEVPFQEAETTAYD